jgi:predicted GNAT family acetyltransferase
VIIGRPMTMATTNPLDNPIWHALSTRLERFAEVSGIARQFPPGVTTLAGCAEPTQEAFDSLAQMGTDGRVSVLFLERVVNPPDAWNVIAGGSLIQMEGERDRNLPAAQREDIIELSAEDAPEMLALAKLTNPGPFGNRTHELGTYLGIHSEGKLVAMAGERLRLPGYTEISAVCTHPEFLGRGFAGTLIAALMKCMRKKDEKPILHVRADNSRAIELYQRLGFVERRRFEVLVITLRPG